MRHILLFQKRNLPGVCVCRCGCVGVCGGMGGGVGVAMYSFKPEGKISSTECPENF